MVRGRVFSEWDHEKGERTIIVDEHLARRFWGDRDPVGQRMYRPESPGAGSERQDRVDAGGGGGAGDLVMNWCMGWAWGCTIFH